MLISGYRCMWLMVMFDLPVDTKQARRAYSKFRKFLLEDGFRQMQYSVYARCCPSKENMAVHLARVRMSVPPDGEVRVLALTDKQYERMSIFVGKMRKHPEKTPEQLTFF